MGRTLVVYGDSIANGLGARQERYAVRVATALDAELLDRSGTALQIDASLQRARREPPGDLTIVAHGVTEALLRPTPGTLRLVPPRWRRPGWLDPRPYRSTRRVRGTAQRMESALRWRVKVGLMRVRAPRPWMTPEDYRRTLAELLAAIDPATTVVLGGAQVDPRFFPGSQASLDRFSAIGRELCQATGATYVDGGRVCRRWEDYLEDRFHPSADGHARIARELLRHLPAASLTEGRTGSPSGRADGSS